MSIRFACKCGKHLRAGDTMAGRHTLCPKCGAIVAIPTKEQAAAAPPPPVPRPSPSPKAAPSTPAQVSDDAEEIGPVLVRLRRRNDKDPNRYRRSIWVPLDPDRGPPPEKLPRPVRTSRRRYEWKLETHWVQSFSYPMRAWRLLAILAIGQTGILAWLATLLPRLSGAGEAPQPQEWVAFSTGALVLATYTVGLFDCVLSSAGAGEYREFSCPGPDLGAPGVVSWVVCLLAGPIVPAIIGIVYWARCGDPDFIDFSILVELSGLAFAYWLLGVLAAREEGKVCASPTAVSRLCFRMGPRALLAAAGTPALAYVCVRLTTFGIVRWHVSGWLGLPWLFAVQFIDMFVAIFLLRVLGVWSYRSRPAGQQEPTPDVTKSDPDPEKTEI
jgi:hypothetical protein